MKILLSIDTWGLVGGTERLAAAVARGLADRGHELTVLCREARSADFAGLGSSASLRVEALDFLNAKSFSKAQRGQIAVAVRSIAPDVIFQQSNCSLAALTELVGLAPLVRFVHDHPPFCPGLNKFRSDGQVCTEQLGVACIERYYFKGGCVCLNRTQYRRRLARWTAPFRALYTKYQEMDVNRRAARLLTNSDYMAGELLQAGFGGELVQRVWPFTLSNTEAQPRGPLGAELQRFLDADERPLILAPARLTHPDKGVDYLLSAAVQIDAPFKLVIAGSGPAEPWLREKALEDELGPDRLFWAGWQDSGAMETLLSRAALVICPSVWQEPFGLVGLEAMAHGKPVVAFAVGGIPEWLTDGETGFLLPRCDTFGMAQAADRLLWDAALRARLGSAGQAQLATRFSQAAHLDALESALSEAAHLVAS